MFKRLKGNKKGFTLTEMIVVIAILGVLAAVATPLITGYIGDAREHTDLANAATLESAVKAAIANSDIAVDSSGLITSPKTTIIAEVKKKVSTIPHPTQSTSHHFVLTLATATVTSTTTAADDDDTIQLD